MNDNTIDNPNREERLNEVLLAYMEEVQAGSASDRLRLLAAHPDLRPELEEFFASHDAVERLAAPLRGATSKSSTGKTVVQGPDSAGPELGQLGDFRLLREIGRGGMGVVYEAEQISLRRRVALKVLPFAAAIDPRQLQRFQNEALAAAHLRHENVVPVYAVGSERGVHFYAMQFVEGQSLASLITSLRRLNPSPFPSPPGGEGRVRGGPTTAPETLGLVLASAETEPGDACRVVAESISQQRSSGGRWYFDWVAGLGRQAAVALEHAHQMGIVHRDVKPANLLLDAHGQLWVTDFGLAQFSSDTGLTVTGEVLGTLRYLSPEQALARRGMVDHRSDVYSLGATLYELLTLQPLFDGRDRHELLRQIAEAEPRPPRSVDRAISEELETIVLKALAKEPAERYATAKELADDLQRFLEDRPIRARRPSLREKATKWARRHRAVVTSALAALLLTVAGLAVATVLTARAYEREHQKAREADKQRARAEESFRQARHAVDQLAQIGEEELAGKQELEWLRWRLLQAALTYYQDFLAQERDRPSIQKELEGSRAKVKIILDELTTLMGANRYIPLHQRGVQDELGLSKEQRVALARINDRWHTGVRESFRQSPGEWERRRLELARAQEAEVARLLEPAQLRRFKQIALQYLGARALSDPEVVAALKLTAAQRQKIRAIQDEAHRPPPGFPAGRGPNPKDNRRPDDRGKGGNGWSPDEHARAVNNRLLDVLTTEQKARWAEMTGEPFQGDFGPGFRGRFGAAADCGRSNGK